MLLVRDDIATWDLRAEQCSGLEIAELHGAWPAAGDLLVFDVDLLDISKVIALRERLRRMDRPPAIAFSVETHSYRARAQAYALGAHKLLPRPLTLEALRALEELSEARDKAACTMDEVVGNSADALDATFAALAEKSNLQIESVRQSGDEILTAISQVGIRDWLQTVRTIHEGTFQHCLIVTGLMTNFGLTLGMSKTDISTLSTAGLLHDIGKVRIPAEILDKPGKLTDEEFAIVRQHPVIGHDYLRVQAGMSPEILFAVRHHHEMLDGSGYPDGLGANRIGDLTRILTVCDIYGALVEHRAYKPQALPEEAMAVLFGMAENGKLEPALVNAMARTVGVRAR